MDSAKLSELRTDAKHFANMTGRNFVTDEEWNIYINHAIKDFYNKITTIENDYYLKPATLTVSTTDSIALPSDFWKLRAVDAKLGGLWHDIKKFNLKERNVGQTNTLYLSNSAPQFKYRLIGSNIVLRPQPAQNTEIKLWYYPVLSELVNDDDTFDFINGADDYVSMSAAVKALIKEETDYRPLEQQVMKLESEIFKIANRDDSAPEKVTDIHDLDAGLYGYY